MRPFPAGKNIVFKNGEDFVPRYQRPHPVPFEGLIISSESCVGGDPLPDT
ncbi:hypothetical protein ASZ90_014681 [hydrocarbon metagenome]|uniref:Uncharacterized protein n=1 Tax=hydrocarbon metagenome TaxID=938273 RepID=A0A0W8F4C0_9ZZZZ